jgi:hypothetical protein
VDWSRRITPRAEFVKKLRKERLIAVDDLGFVSESLCRSWIGHEMWEKLPLSGVSVMTLTRTGDFAKPPDQTKVVTRWVKNQSAIALRLKNSQQTRFHSQTRWMHSKSMIRPSLIKRSRSIFDWE